MYQQQFSLATLPGSLPEFKIKALRWAEAFAQVAYYEPNQITYPYQGFRNFLAVSDVYQPVTAVDALADLQAAAANAESTESILCCILSYELKNQVEALSSQHPDRVGFPLIHFFRPQITIDYQEAFIQIRSDSDNCAAVFKAIAKQTLADTLFAFPPKITPRLSQAEYLQRVQQVQQHIREGDVYELNLCQEFYAEPVRLEPVAAFAALNQQSPMPFAGFYKVNNTYLLCASPERFLKKTGSKLISQPIKGTRRRGQTPAEDAQLRRELTTNEKEIAENMMIMDLVRNDLARCSQFGSVQVEEMFQVYSFRQVLQMITTVTSTARPGIGLAEMIRSTFPMGSMTGAPKVRALELIEQYEAFARGLFSGSLGYILPNGDFDFNVVIRSLQWNRATGYLSFAVGSAITHDSVPEQEYAECLLKAEAIRQILS